MKKVEVNNLINYFSSRGWTLKSSDISHFQYAPPVEMNLPDEFVLDLPKNDNSSQYNIYVENLIEITEQIYNQTYQSKQDISNVLGGKSAIVALRVADADTADGSINFVNYNKQIDKIHEVIKEAVGFSLTNQQYFVNTPKHVSDAYLNQCRGLQTAVGSFITKVKLPYNTSVDSTIDSLNTTDVVGKIGNTYDFILRDIINTPIEQVDNNYMQQHREVFSIQLVDRIQQLYSQSNINNSDMYISTINYDMSFHLRNFLQKTKHLQAFTRKARKILMQTTPLDARGKIIRLNSKNPELNSGHKILLRSEINNSIVPIMATLTRDDYRKAIEAHRNSRVVHITGYATETRLGFQIDNPETFSLE